MPMSLFGTQFPDIAAAETRTITVVDSDRLPAGCYGLLEFFCDEIDCDCRRVILMLGGTGFISSFVVRYLVDGGHRVAVFHREYDS